MVEMTTWWFYDNGNRGLLALVVWGSHTQGLSFKMIYICEIVLSKCATIICQSKISINDLKSDNNKSVPIVTALPVLIYLIWHESII